MIMQIFLKSVSFFILNPNSSIPRIVYIRDVRGSFFRQTAGLIKYV